MMRSQAPEHRPRTRVRALPGCTACALLLALLPAALPCGGALAQGGEARTPPPPEDPELLEFLGSSDPSADNSADDGAWIDYLSRTDIGRVARNAPPRPIQGEKPRAASAPPGTPATDVRHD